MYLLPLAFVLGAIVGMFAGGDPREVRDTEVVAPPAVIGGLALTILVGLWRDAPAPGLLLGIGLACCVGGAVANRHLAGTWVVAVGCALNLVTVLMNGHVAVDPAALVEAGVVSADQLDLVILGAGRELQTEGTTLPVLGAVIPVSFVNEVFTFGDFVLIAGLANLGFRLLLPPLETEPPAGGGVAEQVIDLRDQPPAPPAVANVPGFLTADRPVTTVSGEAHHPPPQSPHPGHDGPPR